MIGGDGDSIATCLGIALDLLFCDSNRKAISDQTLLSGICPITWALCFLTYAFGRTTFLGKWNRTTPQYSGESPISGTSLS